MIRVTYQGSHNFDFDHRLEVIAGRPREASGMDFDSMTRWVDFEFQDGEREKLFAAAVQSAFQGFTVIRDM